MKIHLKGYVKDITNNEITKIDTNAIKTKNKISYQTNKEYYTLHMPSSEKLILNRKTNTIDCTYYFIQNKTIPSIYCIKENDLSLEFNIRTDNIEKTNNHIKINYTVTDTNNKFEYNIEMSE